jgi:hypothetical protein
MQSTVRQYCPWCHVVGYKRQIVFLTDGGISGSEEAAMFELIKAPAKSSSTGESEGEVVPVFCLGIGHGVHRSLLDGE